MAATAVASPVPAGSSTVVPAVVSVADSAPTTAAAGAGGGAQLAVPSSALRLITARLRDYAASTLEQRKPWGELLDRSSFSKPATMQEAVSRLRRNAGYFRVNYLIVAVLTIAGSFITHPSSLLVLVGLAALWVYMFALKQGPLVLGDREFSEREKLAGMLAMSFLVVFFFSNVGTVVMSSAILSAGIIGLHGAARVPDDLFLDDADGNAGLLSIFTGSSTAATGVNNV